MSKCNKLYIYSLNCLTWSSLTLPPILWVFLYLCGHSSVPIGLFADDSLTLPRISILIALVLHPTHSSWKHMPMPMVFSFQLLANQEKCLSSLQTDDSLQPTGRLHWAVFQTPSTGSELGLSSLQVCCFYILCLGEWHNPVTQTRNLDDNVHLVGDAFLCFTFNISQNCLLSPISSVS